MRKQKIISFILIPVLLSCSSKNFSPELEAFMSNFEFEFCYTKYVVCEYESNARMFNRATGETIDTCYTYRKYDKSDTNNLYYKYETSSTSGLLNDLDHYGYSCILIEKVNDEYIRTYTVDEDVETKTVTSEEALTEINETIRKAEGTYNLKASGLYYGDMLQSLYNYQELLSINEDKTILTYHLKNVLLEDVNIFNLKVDVDQKGMILSRNFLLIILMKPINMKILQITLI